MRLMLKCVLLTFCSAIFALGQNIEPLGAFADNSASPALLQALESKGYRVALSGQPFCDIWLRKELPVVSKPEGTNQVYPQLGRSTLLGVIAFPNDAKDFRGKAIRAGAYSMRYEVQPSDGDHLGTAPSRDFVVLAPVAADPDPQARYGSEELNNLSRQASGTRHPAPLYLAQPEGNDSPRVWENFEGHVMFGATATKQGGGTMPLAVVIKGEAQQ
jgi:hypothetical protein